MKAEYAILTSGMALFCLAVVGFGINFATQGICDKVPNASQYEFCKDTEKEATK